MSKPEVRTCGAFEVHKRLLKEDPHYKKNILKIEQFTKSYCRNFEKAGLRSGVITIPVVVHVVYHTSSQNISNAQIQSQITILNEDYRRLNSDAISTPSEFQSVAADARIQFQLAVRDPNCNATTGITRTSTTVETFSSNDEGVKFAATGGHDAWPRDKYLNIWVCPLGLLPNGMQLLGYAPRPGGPAATDGVVIHYTAFGDTGTALSPFDRGRTATHEIGHWLNLIHIWGDATCGDDLVADTPVHDEMNLNCPIQPHLSTCSGNPREMTMNYMDYTDDACMNLFTAGQSTRMDATLYGPRQALVASDALIPPPSTPSIDLWSQDTTEDIGNEPNTIAADMWLSDDIWVRRQNDGITYQEHQNPEYRAPGSPPNYVYVRIRNLGCMGSGSGDVKVYWAKASTALGWPAPWDGSVVTPAPMGGSIGTKPTGNVPAGGFVILEFPWSPPNPADYSSFGADRSHFCLLSRIETSSTSPFGMTIPEGSNLNANVRNNNNIVWKNVTVLEPSGNRIGYVSVGNIMKRVTLNKLSFTSPSRNAEQKPRSILEWGIVEIDLGKTLFKRWKDGGSVGEGIAAVGGTKIKVSWPNAWIGNLKFRPKELRTISVQFTPIKTQIKTYSTFFFDITQYISYRKREKVLGGQRFIIKSIP